MRFLAPELLLPSVVLTCGSYLFASAALLWAVNLRLHRNHRWPKAKPLAGFCALLLIGFITSAWLGQGEILRRLILVSVVAILFGLAIYQYLKHYAQLHQGERMIVWMLIGSLSFTTLTMPIGLIYLQDSQPALLRQIAFIGLGFFLVWSFASIYACHLFDALDKHHQDSVVDSLTGCYNRRFLVQEASRVVSQAKRYHHCLSLMMIDIDRFKQVNDNYGHKVGDQVLQAFSRSLSDNLRREDILTRYGGEEFVILLPQTDITQAKPLAERMRNAIEKIHITSAPELQLTASLGISVMHVDETIHRAIERANHALLQAKESGRNRVVTWQANVEILRPPPS